jgi:hypothetical protein
MRLGRELEIMTAHALANHTIPAARLTIYIENFIHFRWFLVYPLLGYNMILGKDFIEEVPHDIDLATNILHLQDYILKGLDYNNSNRQRPPSENQSS